METDAPQPLSRGKLTTASDDRPTGDIPTAQEALSQAAIERNAGELSRAEMSATDSTAAPISVATSTYEDDLAALGGPERSPVADVARRAIGAGREAAPGEIEGTSGPITRVIDLSSPSRAAVPRRVGLPPIDLNERLGRVILSAVLAVLLWVYVVNLENPTLSTQFKNIAVDVRGAAGNVKVIAAPTAVDATVQGPQNVLGTLNKSDIHPYIDVTGLQEGVHPLTLLGEVANDRARDVSVTFSPKTIQVQLEVQVTRSYTVSVQTLGTPAIGYGLEPAGAKPDQVQVTGSQDAISRVARVVAQVDVEGKAGTQQGARPLMALDASGQEVKGITFEPTTVNVVAPIKLLLNYKVVPVRVPLQGQPATGYQVAVISFDPTTVTVCCSPRVLEPLGFLDTNPVPITGTTSTIITTTELVLPNGVELYPGQPKTISVTVRVETFETTLPVSVAPTIDGLDPALSSVVSPDRLDLTLTGTFSQLQNLRPSDIRAVLNAKGRGAGTYTLTPQVVLPQGVKLQSMSPEQVTLTLIAPTPLPIPTQTAVPPTPTPTTEPSHTPTIAAVKPATATVATITPRPQSTATVTVEVTATHTAVIAATAQPALTASPPVTVTITSTATLAP